MRREIVALLILASFLIPVDAEGNGLFLDFHAESTGGDDNSISTYSYLRESRIQESGYTRGLKSGSFNYINKGKKIDFNEALNLNYGNGTNVSNSTLSHTLNLSFDGGNAISELYGNGLFPNNRGLSAWKKIRYEKSNWLKTKEGELIRDFDANNIWVDASVDMNTRKTSEYVFSYTAGAKDAVIETWDAAGWSNRTGSRRIDVEHSTLMTGNFIVTQTFQEIMPPAAEPVGDWLPCCFNGTIPPFKQRGDVWPAGVVIETLRADHLQPTIMKVKTCDKTTDCGKWKLNNSTKELEKLCKLNISTAKEQKGEEVCGEWRQNKSTKEWEKTCKLNVSTVKEQTCKEFEECPTGGCPGFQCINTFNEPEYDSFPETESQKRLVDIQLTYGYSTSKVLFPPITASQSGVDFDKDGNTDEADQVVYELLVKNTGRTSLNNLTLKGTLPENAISNLSYEVTVDESGAPIISLIDPVWDSTQRSFTYKLGSMNTGTRKTIHLRVFMKDAKNIDEAKFTVVGNTVDGSVVQDEASWLPAYEMDLDLALTKALEKKMPSKKETYIPPGVIYDNYTVNETYLIYKVRVENPDNRPLRDVILAVMVPEKADPRLSYEVIFRNDSVEDVINWRLPPEKTIIYPWPEIAPNEYKEIHILVSTENSADFDIDSFVIETKATRTDGSRFATGEKDPFEDKEIIQKAFEIAKEKIKP